MRSVFETYSRYSGVAHEDRKKIKKEVANTIL